jgi:hypothetical protein
MELKQFLSEFGDSLREKINLRPVFDPEQMDDWDTLALEKIKRLKRQPKPGQPTAILASAKGFYREGKKAVVMVGEMGTGKVRRFGA